MARIGLAAIGLVAGLVLAAAVPSLPLTARRLTGLPAAVSTSGTVPAAVHGGGEAEHGHEAEGRIAITADQAAAAGIAVAPVAGGMLVNRVAVPGVLAASSDRLARVTARVGGTVAEVRTRLGDTVAAGDVLAVTESREIADAKGEFLTAGRAATLAGTTLARETRLWRQRISAEQDVLQARAAAEEARTRVDLARQRLSALGLSDAEMAAMPRQPAAGLRRLELRASIAGQVTARAAALGAAVAADAELFTVADLSVLWVEMAIPPRDLPAVQRGQAVTITGEATARGQGSIVFLSPVLDAETRSAQAVGEIGNADGNWRPGSFVTAHLATAGQRVEILVPRDAVQEVEREKVLFVRTPEGFEKREVALGREDADAYEVVFGLDAGTEVATVNAFALRAELGKAEAGHSH